MPLRSSIAFLLIGLIGVPMTARAAESYLGLYGGLALTEDSSVKATVERGPFSADESASETVDYDPDYSFGLRGGVWWESVPWLGLAGDLSYFQAESEEAEFDITSISPMLMLRIPLDQSDDYPGGRIFPYAGVGPSLFYVKADADLRPAVSRRVSESAWNIGYQALAGLEWRFHRRWSLFGEYRYTYRDIEADQSSDCFFCFDGDGVEATLKTHHLLLGVSLWF